MRHGPHSLTYAALQKTLEVLLRSKSEPANTMHGRERFQERYTVEEENNKASHRYKDDNPTLSPFAARYSTPQNRQDRMNGPLDGQILRADIHPLVQVCIASAPMVAKSKRKKRLPFQVCLSHRTSSKTHRSSGRGNGRMWDHLSPPRIFSGRRVRLGGGASSTARGTSTRMKQ